MPNMVFETNKEPRSGRDFLITIHKSVDPTVEEWDAYIENFKRSDPETMLQLVFTDGGGPSAKQRKDFNELLHGRTTTCSVVTSSSMIRGVVTAFNWFNPKIKSFSPSEMHAALRHLTVDTDSQLEWTMRIVRRLRDKLGAADLKSIILPAA